MDGSPDFEEGELEGRSSSLQIHTAAAHFQEWGAGWRAYTWPAEVPMAASLTSSCEEEQAETVEQQQPGVVRAALGADPLPGVGQPGQECVVHCSGSGEASLVRAARGAAVGSAAKQSHTSKMPRAARAAVGAAEALPVAAVAQAAAGRPLAAGAATGSAEASARPAAARAAVRPEGEQEAGAGEGLTLAVAASRRVRIRNVGFPEARYQCQKRQKLEDRLLRMSREAGIGLTREELRPLSKQQLVSELLGLEARLSLLGDVEEEWGDMLNWLAS